MIGIILGLIVVAGIALATNGDFLQGYFNRNKKTFTIIPPPPNYCINPHEIASGGDKYSVKMLVGQEYWESQYSSFKENDFEKLLPEHIQNKLNKINEKSNCFFSAVDFHLKLKKDEIMKNTELKKILDENYCELKEDTEIKFGDLITIETPNEKSDNFHHAAIILNKHFILDKPDSGSSSLRIAPIQILFDEWGHYWDCPSPPWPMDEEYKCINFRFWRYNN